MEKIIGILLVIVLIGAGIFIMFQESELSKRCTMNTVGTVVQIEKDIDTSENSGGTLKYTYYPVIQYIVNNKTITKKSSIGTGHQKYAENEKIDILYDPNNIEDYIIKGDISSNMLGIIMIISGVVLALSGFGIIKIRQ